MTYEIVIIGEGLIGHELQREAVEDVDATIETVPDSTSEVEIVDIAESVDAIVVGPNPPVTEMVLQNSDTLRVVGRAGIGVDNIDVQAAADNGVTVVNVPSYCIEEVSTHAFSLLLACVRKLPIYHGQTDGDNWKWELGKPIHRFRTQTVGLFGFGNISRRLAEKLDEFDVNLVVYDPYISAEEIDEYGGTKVNFEELLSRSDAISIHTPLTDETRDAFDADAFSLMKESAILVNTARGGIIDEDALYDALVADEIGMAGLDVLEEEPPGDSQLFDLREVIITPHVSWYSEESQRDLGRSVLADVIRVLSGEQPEEEVTPD